MPGKIKILDENTISKIAAGEVVERPASVVKELVENSIDAGSSRIEVEVQDGGRKLIRVSDNGQGMTKEDALLSLERHSTSKIDKVEDIFSINSLGFRGEALPSIASVSIFELITRPAGASEGTKIRIDGGKDKKAESFGCAEGTTVIVKRLFHNVPARKKYLRSPATESSHIIDLISKLTLACPGISFRLIQDGKEIIFSEGSGKLKDAVSSIYGSEITDNLMEINYNDEYLRITGLVSKPNLTRIGRRDHSFFVNSRPVKNFLLSRSLEQAYRALIPKDRSPISIIFIDIDPREIDVNVHPAKREIRFLKTSKVLETLKSCVEAALGSLGKDSIPSKTAPDYQDIEYISNIPSAKPGRSSKEAEEIRTEEIRSLTPDQTSEEQAVLLPLAQVLNTYIVAQNGSKLILIDQHAAHERILFDKLKEKDNLGSQNLLIPESLELKRDEFEAAEKHLNIFRAVGFDIESFGKNSFLLRAVPYVVGNLNPKELFSDIISELLNFGRSDQIEKVKDKLKALLACHGATKAGDSLSFPEMKRLLLDLERTENPATCPHGRPTMVEISKEDLEKMFKRR